MPDRMIERLRCQMTEKERVAKGELLARMGFEMGDLENAKAAATRDYTNQIKNLKTEQTKVAEDVRSGTEERDVECVEKPDWKEHVVTIVRCDTGEIVRRRPMTPTERQLRFDAFSARVKDDEDPDPPKKPGDEEPEEGEPEPTQH